MNRGLLRAIRRLRAFPDRVPAKAFRLRANHTAKALRSSAVAEFPSIDKFPWIDSRPSRHEHVHLIPLSRFFSEARDGLLELSLAILWCFFWRRIFDPVAGRISKAISNNFESPQSDRCPLFVLFQSMVQK